MPKSDPIQPMDARSETTAFNNVDCDPLSTAKDNLTQYLPELRSFIAGKIRDANRIDDIAQETIARTYKSADIDSLKNPLAYLISVAKTVLCDQWKSSHDVDTSVDPDSLASTPKTIEQQHVDLEKIRAVSSALNRMPPLRRRVFEMRRLHGMSREEIAMTLDLNVESVKKHINRAMVDITMHMEKHGW